MECFNTKTFNYKFVGALTIQGGKVGPTESNKIKADDLENIFFLYSLFQKQNSLGGSKQFEDRFRFVSCSDIYSFKKAESKTHYKEYDKLSKEIYEFFGAYKETDSTAIKDKIPLIIDASILLFISSSKEN